MALNPIFIVQFFKKISVTKLVVKNRCVKSKTFDYKNWSIINLCKKANILLKKVCNYTFLLADVLLADILSCIFFTCGYLQLIMSASKDSRQIMPICR